MSTSKQKATENCALERALLSLLAQLGPSKTRILARRTKRSAQVVGSRLFAMTRTGLVDSRPESGRQGANKIWFLPTEHGRIFAPKSPPPQPARTEPKPRLPESAYVTSEDIAWMNYWKSPKTERKAMQPPAGCEL